MFDDDDSLDEEIEEPEAAMTRAAKLHSQVPLPYSLLAESFGFLKEHAETCGAEDASPGLRRESMTFIAGSAQSGRHESILVQLGNLFYRVLSTVL